LGGLRDRRRKGEGEETPHFNQPPAGQSGKAPSVSKAGFKGSLVPRGREEKWGGAKERKKKRGDKKERRHKK